MSQNLKEGNNTMKKELFTLREAMKKHNIDIYYIPSNDFHSSEYVGEHFQFRKYISGFTGSAATLVVTLNDAFLWTDGRYFTQGENELKDSGISLMKMNTEGYPTVIEYLENNLDTKMTLALDGRCINAGTGLEIEKIAVSKGASFIYDIDLADEVWKMRPAPSTEKVWLLDEQYAGESVDSKLHRVKTAICEITGCTKDNYAFLVTSLDEIAWLLNLRGNDIKYCPLFLSYLIITDTDCTLYIDENKLSPHILYHLNKYNIKTSPYLDIYISSNNFLTVKSRIFGDFSTINYTLIKHFAGIENYTSPISIFKAIKNPTECINLKKAHIKDGIALIKFSKWLKENPMLSKETELSVAEKLIEFRKMGMNYIEESFEPIMGYKDHGAIIHYSATYDSSYSLSKEGFLLSDTGAHYMEGTTDVTRTFMLGKISDEMKYHYTLVLKSHLRLLAITFKEGTTGQGLDIISRAPIWEAGLNYNHGTGHGVGYLLNVHEGPHAIRFQTSENKSEATAFVPGMITSNEPGLYFPGQYGIRLENLMLCIEKISNEYGNFYGFEPLTLCPFELEAIDFSLLDTKELSTLNNYHRLVYNTISPYLSEDEKIWLWSQTREVKNM